jgi:hypothetical protein
MPAEFRNGLELLNAHRSALGERFTPPDPVHYPNGYLWDLGFHAITRTFYGDAQGAAAEIEEVLSWQSPDSGFIPNMRFYNGSRKDLERRLTFTNPDVGSNYSQPPVLADAVWETYQTFEKQGKHQEARDFLSRNYPALRNFYTYFSTFRANSDTDNLIGVIHPHETGRDADPTFDFAKKRIPYDKKAVPAQIARKLNAALDYGSTINLGRRLKQKDWDPQKSRDVFWVNDVMFNCIYAQNLKYLSPIALALQKPEDAESFSALSQSVEKDILQHLWDSNDNLFYAQRPEGRIKVVSVSNLFPLALVSIDRDQIEALVKLMESKEWFNTAYPVPSVPVNSHSYDPGFSEPRIWRGPVWINMNWYLVNALKKQAQNLALSDNSLALRCNAVAANIIKSSKELVRKSGYREFYHPHTGKGLRKSVKSFGWSTLADTM